MRTTLRRVALLAGTLALGQCGLLLDASDYAVGTPDGGGGNPLSGTQTGSVGASIGGGAAMGTQTSGGGGMEMQNGGGGAASGTGEGGDASVPPDAFPDVVDAASDAETSDAGGPQCMPSPGPGLVVSCDLTCPLPEFCCLNFNEDVCYSRDANGIQTCLDHPGNPIPGVPDYCDDADDCCPDTVCCAFTTGSPNWPTVSLVACVPRAQCPAPNQRLCDPNVAGQCDNGESCAGSSVLGGPICEVL